MNEIRRTGPRINGGLGTVVLTVCLYCSCHANNMLGDEPLRTRFFAEAPTAWKKMRSIIHVAAENWL